VGCILVALLQNVLSLESRAQILSRQWDDISPTPTPSCVPTDYTCDLDDVDCQILPTCTPSVSTTDPLSSPLPSFSFSPSPSSSPSSSSSPSRLPTYTTSLSVKAATPTFFRRWCWGDDCQAPQKRTRTPSRTRSPTRTRTRSATKKPSSSPSPSRSSSKTSTPSHSRTQTASRTRTATRTRIRFDDVLAISSPRSLVAVLTFNVSWLEFSDLSDIFNQLISGSIADQLYIPTAHIRPLAQWEGTLVWAFEVLPSDETGADLLLKNTSYAAPSLSVVSGRLKEFIHKQTKSGTSASKTPSLQDGLPIMKSGIVLRDVGPSLHSEDTSVMRSPLVIAVSCGGVFGMSLTLGIGVWWFFRHRRRRNRHLTSSFENNVDDDSDRYLDLPSEKRRKLSEVHPTTVDGGGGGRSRSSELESIARAYHRILHVETIVMDGERIAAVLPDGIILLPKPGDMPWLATNTTHDVSPPLRDATSPREEAEVKSHVMTRGGKLPLLDVRALPEPRPILSPLSAAAVTPRAYVTPPPHDNSSGPPPPVMVMSFTPIKGPGVQELERKRTMDELRDAFTCSVCLEQYSKGRRHRPMRLAECGHTFCEHCIHHLRRTKQPYCPVCRDFFSDCHLNVDLMLLLG